MYICFGLQFPIYDNFSVFYLLNKYIQERYWMITLSYVDFIYILCYQHGYVKYLSSPYSCFVLPSPGCMSLLCPLDYRSQGAADSWPNHGWWISNENSMRITTIVTDTLKLASPWGPVTPIGIGVLCHYLDISLPLIRYRVSWGRYTEYGLVLHSILVQCSALIMLSIFSQTFTKGTP